MCDTLKKKKSKRTFSEMWLNDDRFKSWIRKVPFDNSLFHCVVCNKNFSCNTSHVLRHADSACHKNNIKGNTLPLLLYKGNVSSNKKIVKKRFKIRWLEIDQFKPWLREVPNNATLAFCTFCNKSIAAGLSQIHRHAESKKHLMTCDKHKTENKYSEDEDTSESFLPFEERKKIAEIHYAALIAEKNISHQTANEILTFFQAIGEDFNVLKNMSMGRTKCTNIIANVLYPVETNRVVNSLQNTKFSVSIENLHETSDISNDKWMTFFARYVDPKTLDSRSQLVKLINIDARDYNAEKLFNAFKSEMCKLNISFSNIVALSCDNTSIMTDKHSSFKKQLEEMCKNLLTLVCPCHSAALAAHVACAKIPDYCEDFLEKIANFINSNPKCSAVCQEFRECFQETNRKILKLSNTRWLSHYSCVKRLLESWDTVKLFLNENVSSEKTKSGIYLLSMMQNLDIKAYILFLKHILHYFNSFSSFFQAVETRVHLLQPKSVEFLSTVCRHFIKPELLKNLSTIKFAEKKNQKLLEEIHLGIECEEYLDKLLKEGHADVVVNVRENCLQFYVTASEEISKRLPINDEFLSKLKVFQCYTAILNNNRETSFNDVSFIAQTFGDFDKNGLKTEWFNLHLDFATEKEKLFKLNFDDMWKQILQSQCSADNDKYPNLKLLLNAVRSLPNSNADPERMFSVLTDIKTKKRNKLSSASVNAICVFKSALKSRKETVLDMEIDTKHLSLMSSDKLYNKPKTKNKQLTYADNSDNNIAGPSSSHDTQ